MMVTQEEAARLLGKSIRFVFRLRAAGELAFMPGRPVMIYEDSLNRYIEQRRTTWDAGTKGHGSSSTTAACGKSGGPTRTAAASAFQRGAQTARKRTATSRASSWKCKGRQTSK